MVNSLTSESFVIKSFSSSCVVAMYIRLYVMFLIEEENTFHVEVNIQNKRKICHHRHTGRCQGMRVEQFFVMSSLIQRTVLPVILVILFIFCVFPSKRRVHS